MHERYKKLERKADKKKQREEDVKTMRKNPERVVGKMESCFRGSKNEIG